MKQTKSTKTVAANMVVKRVVLKQLNNEKFGTVTVVKTEDDEGFACLDDLCDILNLFKKEAPVDGQDLTLENYGFFGYKAADFAERLAAGEVPHKILLMAEPELCERAEAELSARFPMFHVVRSAAFLLEIMDASVSKASGIAVMLKHFGLTAEEALSFGDNYNDIEMLELTGRSVAMGNAPDVIKKLATDITAANAEDGLAKFLVKEIL